MSENIRTLTLVVTDFWNGESGEIWIKIAENTRPRQEVEVRIEKTVAAPGGDLQAWAAQALRAALDEL